MIVDLGSDNLSNTANKPLPNKRAEEVRLFYVAVTRAKYRCYVAWANERSEKNPNESALAWLMEFAEDNFAQQQAKLHDFMTHSSRTVSVIKRWLQQMNS